MTFKELQSKADLSNADVKQLLGGVSIETIRHWRNNVMPVPKTAIKTINEYIRFKESFA